jgi:predicted acyl esterase
MRFVRTLKLLGLGWLVALLAAASIAAAPAIARAATVAAHGSVQQVYVIGARPGQPLRLLDRRGRLVATKRVGALGGLVFQNVAPGRGYRVKSPAGARSGPVTVLPDRSPPPSTSIYNQRISSSGFGYLTARDGIKLAIDVRLPSGPGPYPTLVEYAGYGYADPYNGPDSGIAQVANILGFAVVDVNMRGTGCSGGAFNYFDALQDLDGYDVIETVARQPWVLHHRVGMIGISYGGISQLFVGQTDPPHLAAIAPLSVIDNTVTTLYPGAILNTGFAVQWAAQRDHDAKPASATGGQSWALRRIQQGDQICKANQVLHPAALSLVGQIRSHIYYVPSLDDPLSPITFVKKIKAPVYLACQWTDEQTGGHCADLAEHFSGTRHKWFTFTNGVHTDSLDPATFDRWFDFLELYVAERAPNLPPLVKVEAPILYNTVFGIPGITVPPDPVQGQSSYATALAAFNRLPQIRILFDNGAGGRSPGDPLPGFERLFPRFPVPGTRAVSWYLGGNGALIAAPPRRAGRDRFAWNKRARPVTDFTGNTGAGGLWGATPNYNWTQNPPGTALSYITAPLKRNTVVIGAGQLQAWVRASAGDIDLQVTISEVRADGKETFVQNGWLRVSRRKLDRGKSTLLEPVLSERRSDVAPLPRGRFTELTIPLYYEGHVYRAGSRIRIVIAAPNGDQPVWSFGNTVPSGLATVWIARSRAMPSRVILPVVAGVSVPTGLPPCPGLRGEPCRQYHPLADRAAT